MEKYITLAVILATPMTRLEYNDYRGWKLPPEEDGSDPGYLTERFDAKANDPRHNGEISWMSENAFKMSCRPSTGMDFGHATGMAKLGFKISRQGWNGPGQFVVYQKGYPDGIPCNAQTAKAFGMQEGEPFKVRPYLQLRCTDGSHQMWTPSVSDCLAGDWYVVE